MEKFITSSKYESLTPAKWKELRERRNNLTVNWGEGTIFSWPEETKEAPVARVFRSIEDAKEYWELRIQIEHCLDAFDTPPITYVIGTENDYQKAVATFEAKKKQKEKKAYFADIARRVKIHERDIKALEALKDVCRTFDGKVINCRFNTAVKQAIGYYLTFGYSFELHFYNCLDRASESTIRINANYLNTVDPYSHNKKVAKEDEWQWQTGDRLEAAKALHVIDCKINDLKSHIDELQGTKKQYTEYLRKARRVEKLIEELNGYNYYIQSWAKEHDLKQYVSAGNIWRG